MPNLKTYDLFISHAWKYNYNYYRLIELLGKARYFSWRNYSVPQHDPKIDPATKVGKKTLEKAICNQIKPVNIVLILSGMYSIYSDWILKELEIASDYSKPIIGVIPWGQQKIPVDIQERCEIMVGWNTESIVNAIRQYSL